MKTDELDYRLPEDRIAQHPPTERDGGRLLVLERSSGQMEHRRILELPELLRRGDLMVRNRSRVLAARLDARRSSGGRVELLLIEPLGRGAWRVLARPAARLRDGEMLHLAAGEAVRLRRDGDDLQIVTNDVDALLARHGRAPLPPYIRRPADDLDLARYQTVYAAESGSSAAPTAGLHLSRPLIEQLRAAGVAITDVLLHVGPGTFLPVRTATLDEHPMHAERIRVDLEAVEAVSAARARGGRVLAIGTTVVRTLEAAASSGRLVPIDGRTDLFIRPGYRFRVVDALLTNFHQPRSTLMALVAAFAGLETIRAAYELALREEYRFLSYGDAMLIV